MLRYQALELVQAFDRAAWQRMRAVRQEMTNIERDEQGLCPLPPTGEEAVYGQWQQWREGMIRKYRLGSLISSDSTNL